MKIKLINDGGFYAENVKFPIKINATRSKGCDGFNVKGVDLIKTGFEFIDSTEFYYFSTRLNECVECRA